MIHSATVIVIQLEANHFPEAASWDKIQPLLRKNASALRP